MQSLIIWANSYCRSTLVFFKEFSRSLGVDPKICVWKPLSEARKKTGFTEDEFGDLDITFIGNNREKAFSIMKEHIDAFHIFGAYQASSLYQDLMKYASEKGAHIAVCSEAPCNMVEGPSLKRIAKDIYLNVVLPLRMKKYIKMADFIVNLSGDDDKHLKRMGWPQGKIIPCGYYPPRIQGTTIVKRTDQHWKKFTILLTGIHEWHRSHMLLLQALSELKNMGIEPVCNITQEGPMTNKMKRYVQKKELTNVNFLGFVEMPKLIQLYESCSVYIGSGNYEPWGMRLNDVLLCGAPLIVNQGMGGVKLLNDYHCGYTFERNNSHSLAVAIMKMMENKEDYLQVANNAYQGALSISPEIQAMKIADTVSKKHPDWNLA